MFQNSPPNLGIKTEISRLWSILITRKVLDARRRGATTEAYGAIRRKEERSKATPLNGIISLDSNSFNTQLEAK
jgi:hypothetical protein